MRPTRAEVARALEVAVRCSPADEGSIWWAAKVLAAELHYAGERVAVMGRAILATQDGAKCGTCGDLGVTAEGWCVDCDWRTNGVKVAMAYRLRSAPNAPTVSDDAIAALRDQLQASQCAEQLLRDELRETGARVDALVAGIRQWASECAECGGNGRADYGPCPDCGDIRALLPEGVL